MKNVLSLLTLGLALSFGSAHAAGTCDAQATEKKLAGAAKTSFLKKCEADSASAMASAAPSAACEKSAADKKLAGAAKTSHIKKCMEDGASDTASAACEKSAADKKLAGAAKTSHLKKCMDDAKMAGAKPTMSAEAKATDTKPMATAKAASAKK